MESIKELSETSYILYEKKRTNLIMDDYEPMWAEHVWDNPHNDSGKFKGKFIKHFE